MNEESEQKATKEPLALRRRACLEEMRDYINQYGPWAVNKTYFSKKYEVQRYTITGWYTNLMRGVRPERIESIRNMGISSLSYAIGECEKILRDPNTKPFLRLKAAERLNDLLKTVTPWLESYGLKDKVAEKTEVLTASLDLNRVLEIAKEKAERLKKVREEMR
jgi:hypothetical protein